eukprot:3776781-Rhodomonas_salina.1
MSTDAAHDTSMSTDAAHGTSMSTDAARGTSMSTDAAHGATRTDAAGVDMAWQREAREGVQGIGHTPPR